LIKLLLTSAGFENPKLGKKFLELVNKKSSDIKIAFVPTASRTKEERFYVNKSKLELVKLGIMAKNIKVLELDHKISYSEIAKFDAAYVCGGNTFYLLYKARETGFDKAVERFVEEGKVYVGVSAGSIMAGPTIQFSHDDNDIKIKHLTGLNLTKIIISPHYTDKEKSEIESNRKKVKSPIIPLMNSQALLVLGTEIKTID
jgi:peptidase E